MAEQPIEAMNMDWDPGEFHDTFRENACPDRGKRSCVPCLRPPGRGPAIWQTGQVSRA